MAPEILLINPWIKLLEAYHLIVFIKVVPMALNAVSNYFTGACAEDIADAKFINACCPSAPAFKNVLPKVATSVCAAFNYVCNLVKSNLPVSTLVAYINACYKTLAASAA